MPINTSFVSTNSIILVNKDHPLERSYIPKNLVSVDEKYCVRPTMLDKLCYQSYLNLLKESGFDLLIYSGYRSYEYQESIYTGDIYQAKPGESEHQTGLAIDVTIHGIGLTKAFGETIEGQWIKENAHKYGFIIRYPNGKENITGFLYEPWHIRYVGSSSAKIIYENQYTLEEYINTLKK